MPEWLSPAQRHCLLALEVDVYARRTVAVSDAPSLPVAAAQPATSTSSTSRPLLLVVAAAERGAPLILALARALGAQLHSTGEPRPPGAVLISIGDAAADAALSLPPLAGLRSDPRAKQRSWLKIRSFLRLLRAGRE